MKANPNGSKGGSPPYSGIYNSGHTVGNSPGLLTSTGGLYGYNGLLLAPAYNRITGKSFILLLDATNFNCEEDSQYSFRQEANFGNISGEGRTCSIHLIILKYRELGSVSFNFNITVFNQILDDYVNVVIPVSLPVIPFARMTKLRKNSFPDGRIHTVKLTPPCGVVSGERPQLSITISGNNGPLSITKVIMCGNADESAQM
jgi:hypothetical protein